MRDDSNDNDNDNDDPVTPRKGNKTLPPSPHKTPRIPLSPWKPDNKEFWDPEVNFAWIDKHSPAKPTRSRRDPSSITISSSSARRLDGEPKATVVMGRGGV